MLTGLVNQSLLLSAARVPLQVQKQLQKSPGMWHEEAGRLSLTKVKEVLANVCVVTLVAGAEDVLDRLRCSCLYFAKASRCCHVVFVAFLLGHHTDYFTELMEYTKKNGPQEPPAEGIKLEKKQYRRAAVPTASAWKRMAEICSAASEKYRAKKRQKTKAQAQGVMQTTPSKEEAGKGQKRDLRLLSLETIRDKLGAKDFHANFAGMHLCIKNAVAVQEAKDYGFGTLILDLKNRSTSGPTKALADKLLKAWVGEAASVQPSR